MTDPVRERQLQELDTVGICTRIFYQARSELYVNMHFLDIPLSSLGFEADWGRNGLAVDGAVILNHNGAQSISVQHRYDIRTVGDLHGRSICIFVQSDYFHSITL